MTEGADLDIIPFTYWLKIEPKVIKILNLRFSSFHRTSHKLETSLGVL